MITDIEQETSDFDCFFTNGEYIGYGASAGGKLPPSVAASKDNLAVLWDYFDGLFYKCDVIVNPKLKKVLETKVYDWQIASFTAMAGRGLFAFDKTAANAFDDPRYHLVASPVDPLKLNELPAEIIAILLLTKYDGAIGDYLNIDELS